MGGGDIKGKNISNLKFLGGGMTYYDTNPKQNVSMIYGEGLRVPNTGGNIELDSLYSTSTLGKKKSYDRVKMINKIRDKLFTSDLTLLLN